MLNVLSVLQHQGLPVNSPCRAMQTVAQTIAGSSFPCRVANNYIKELTERDPGYTDPIRARLVCMGIVEAAVRENGVIRDVEQFIAEQEARADKHIANNAWQYVTEDDASAPVETKAVAEGSDVKVPVKSDGSIKKGGKQTLAADLYQTFLKTTKLDPTKPEFNRAFKDILIKQVDMTEAGATTYTYNMRKKFGVSK